MISRGAGLGLSTAQRLDQGQDVRRGAAEREGGGGSQLTVLLLEKGEERGREVVPKLPQGVGELVPVDGPRSITVEVLEGLLPVHDVFPETLELWTRCI